MEMRVTCQYYTWSYKYVRADVYVKMLVQCEQKFAYIVDIELDQYCRITV